MKFRVKHLPFLLAVFGWAISGGATMADPKDDVTGPQVYFTIPNELQAAMDDPLIEAFAQHLQVSSQAGKPVQVACPAQGKAGAFAAAFSVDGDFRWFEDAAVMEDFSDGAAIVQTRRVMRGYEPLDRDRLEFQIYCAEINPDLVALGDAYARAFAVYFDATPRYGRGLGRDQGDLLAQAPENGFGMWERIGAWRFDRQLVIVRARYEMAYAATVEPKIAQVFGTFGAAKTVDDTVVREEKIWDLSKGFDRPLDITLPGNWQQISEDVSRAPELAYYAFTDANDSGGASALAVYRTAIPADRLKDADPAALRQSVDELTAVALSALLPDPKYRQEEIARDVLPENAAVGRQSLVFFDALTPEDGGLKLAARTTVVFGETDGVIFVEIMGYPDNLEAMIRRNHVDYAVRMALDRLRPQLAP